MTERILRKLREAVYDLATSEDEVLTDEAWYDKLWKLLDPVIDIRAGQALTDVHTHDAGEYRDPSTGEVDVEAHRFTFEGSTTLLAQHLVDEHDVLPGTVEPFAGGVSQGAWVALDNLHREAHEH